jgi:hypothetical protein
MNNNTILLSYILIINKKSQLFNFDNYYWKLIYILNFNIINFDIKLKLFWNKYKLVCNLKKIINILYLSYKIDKIYKIKELFINDLQIKLIPSQINNLINLEEIYICYNRIKFIPLQI